MRFQDSTPIIAGTMLEALGLAPGAVREDAAGESARRSPHHPRHPPRGRPGPAPAATFFTQNGTVHSRKRTGRAEGKLDAAVG